MADPILLDTLQLKKAALQYRAINNKLRQRILRFIHKQGTVRVTPLYKTLKLEQAVASQQLAILRRAGLVQAKRESKYVYYTVNYDRLQQLHELAGRINSYETVGRP